MVLFSYVHESSTSPTVVEGEKRRVPHNDADIKTIDRLFTRKIRKAEREKAMEHQTTNLAEQTSRPIDGMRQHEHYSNELK